MNFFNTDELKKYEKVRRGEIHWIEAQDAVGHEIQKNRPAVVVSNNKQNETSDVIQIVYMTGSPKKNMPTHVHIEKTSNGRGQGSTVLCENVYSISKERLQFNSFMATVSDADMEKIDEALIIALGLDEMETVEESPNEQLRMEAEFYKRQYEALMDRIIEKARI